MYTSCRVNQRKMLQILPYYKLSINLSSIPDSVSCFKHIYHTALSIEICHVLIAKRTQYSIQNHYYKLCPSSSSLEGILRAGSLPAKSPCIARLDRLATYFNGAKYDIKIHWFRIRTFSSLGEICLLSEMDTL